MARSRNAGDQVGGRAYFTQAVDGSALTAAGNGSVRVPNFIATQGHTQITFAVNKPTGAGTWMPQAIDDQGNLINLLSAARAITAAANDGITIGVNFDWYTVTFTDTSGSTNPVGSIYIGEGTAAG